MNDQQIEEYFNIKDYQKVIEHSDTSFNHKQMYRNTLLKGICYYKLKNYDNAKIALEECSRIDVNAYRQYEYLAKIAITEKNLNEALFLCDRLLKIAPNNAYYYILRSMVYKLVGNIENELNDLNASLKLDSTNYKVYKHLGRCYFDSEYTKSLNHFTKAHSLDETKVSVIDNIGLLYMRLDQYQKALDIFMKALKLRPNDKKYFYFIGLCYMKLGQKTDALEYLKIAISIDCNDPNIYFMVGVTEKEMGNYQTAIATIEKSLASGDSNNIHEKYNEIGLCYLNMKDHIKAMDYFKKAVDSKPTYAEGHSNLGLCYFLSKENQKAVEELNKAVSIDDHLIDAYSNLGLVYMTIENYKEAERAYNKVVIYTDFRYDALIKLGTIKMKRKKYTEAKKYFKTAAEFNRFLPIAFYNLGLVYADIHQCAKAREHFNKALLIDPQFSLAKKSIQNLENQMYDKARKKKHRGVGCVGFFF